jgi:hypothetical protein
MTNCLKNYGHDQPAYVSNQARLLFESERESASAHESARAREKVRERERAPWERLTPCHTGQQGNVRQVFSQRKRIVLLVLRFHCPCPPHPPGFLVLFFSSPSLLPLLLLFFSPSLPPSPSSSPALALSLRGPCCCCKWVLSSRSQPNTVGVPGQASIWTHRGCARAAKVRKPRHPSSDSAQRRFWPRRLGSTRRPVRGKTVFCSRG